MEARKDHKLFEAITRGDTTKLQEALAADSDNNNCDTNEHLVTGETPLIYYDFDYEENPKRVCRWLSPALAAAESGCVNIAEAVLEKVCNSFRVNCQKWNTLCEQAIDERAFRLAELLITRFRPNSNNHRSSSESEAFGRMLLMAAEEGVCSLAELLLNTADPNHCHGKRTPLIVASLKGNMDMCRLLVSRGARVNSD